MLTTTLHIATFSQDMSLHLRTILPSYIHPLRYCEAMPTTMIRTPAGCLNPLPINPRLNLMTSLHQIRIKEHSSHRGSKWIFTSLLQLPLRLNVLPFSCRSLRHSSLTTLSTKTLVSLCWRCIFHGISLHGQLTYLGILIVGKNPILWESLSAWEKRTPSNPSISSILYATP